MFQCLQNLIGESWAANSSDCCLFLSSLGARLASTAQEPAPGASSYLAGTAESFLASCRSDVEDGKKRIADLKASPPPRDAMTTLQAFDTAAGGRSLTPKIAPAWPSRCIPRSPSAMRPRLANRKSAACSPTSRSIKTCTRCWRRSMAPGSILPAAITCGPHCATTIAPGLTATIPPGRKYERLQDELVKIGQQFDQNIAADVRKFQVNASDLDGLPEDFKRSHPPDASGKVTLTTDNTDYFPFMDYAKSEAGAERVLCALPAARLSQKHRRAGAAFAEASRTRQCSGISRLGRLHYRRQDGRHGTECRRLYRKNHDRGAGRFKTRLRRIAGLQET